MKLKNVLFSFLALLLLMITFSHASNVNNYFQQAGSGTENTLVITGTQTVSGYLNVTGTQSVSGTMSVADLTATGLITGSSCTITNTITGGTITDGTITINSGMLLSGVTVQAGVGDFDHIYTSSITGGSPVYFQNEIDMQGNNISDVDTLAVTYGIGTATGVFSGLVTASSTTVTNQVQAGSITDTTATWTAGAITGLLDFTSSSGTVTNQLTSGSLSNAGTIYSTGAITTGGLLTSSSSTVTNLLSAGSLSTTGLINLGAMEISYVVASDSTTLTSSSNTVVECSKAGAMEVILPTAVGNTGLYFLIKKTGSAGAITITTNSTETIDGDDDPTNVDAQYDFLGIVSNGTNWVVINRYIQ